MWRHRRSCRALLLLTVACLACLAFFLLCTSVELHLPGWRSTRECSEDEAALLERHHREAARGRQIPRILHQVFVSSVSTGMNAEFMLPIEYQKLISACLQLNPDWQYFLWRNEDIEAFIGDHFPHFMDKYRNYKETLQRSDIIRYMILYHYGGIYLDMDVQCVKPFFPRLMAVGPAFLDQERKEHAHIIWEHEHIVMNSAMGSVPRHPFFLSMLSAVNCDESHGKDVQYSTGTLLLTRVYSDWIKTPAQLSDPVILLEPEVFDPLVDIGQNLPHRCSKIMQEKARTPVNATSARQRWKFKGCELVQAKNWKIDATNPNTTIGKHLFLHLGFHSVPNSGGKFNILAEHPEVKMYKGSGAQRIQPVP